MFCHRITLYMYIITINIKLLNSILTQYKVYVLCSWDIFCVRWEVCKLSELKALVVTQPTTMLLFSEDYFQKTSILYLFIILNFTTISFPMLCASYLMFGELLYTFSLWQYIFSFFCFFPES